MPFSAPTTVASQANAGYLSIFQLGSGSPTTYATIAEVKEFSYDPISMPEIDCTHLLSPANTEEFVPGMIKPGKVTFSGNFIGDTSQLNISTLAKAQTIFPFKVLAPVQRNASTYTLTSNGFISGLKMGPFKNNEAIQFQAEIQLTGTYTETVT